jgi:L-serine dehydratase
LRVSELMMANERAWRSDAEIRNGLLHIWSVMRECVEQGLRHEGILPGGLNVPPRGEAPQPAGNRQAERDQFDAVGDGVGQPVRPGRQRRKRRRRAHGHRADQWRGRDHSGGAALLHEIQPGRVDDDVVAFFMGAAAVGILCKKNASISGAEVGCQGEVGSACAMAAAGLAEVLGATPEQLENAAEIGLEHNLGLTCDPVGGLVQVPCIERNAIAAVKAINARKWPCAATANTSFRSTG